MRCCDKPTIRWNPYNRVMQCHSCGETARHIRNWHFFIVRWLARVTGWKLRWRLEDNPLRYYTFNADQDDEYASH